MFSIDTLGLTIASGTIITVIATFALIADIIFARGTTLARPLAPYARAIAIILTGTAAGMSLVYSDVLGFVPCALCWLQRVFLYPQFVMGVVSVRMKDRVMLPRYGIALSAIGLLVSIYQYIHQLLPEDALPCPIRGSANCYDTIIHEFGFVTFPLAAAAAFALLIVLYWIMIRNERRA